MEQGKWVQYSSWKMELIFKQVCILILFQVNIRGEDIVDGNPKLTLGLIWTIILHFQVGTVNLGFT